MRLGKWLLLNKIGDGGQGTVHKVIDTEKAFNAKRSRTRIGDLMRSVTDPSAFKNEESDKKNAMNLVAMFDAMAEFDECFGALKQLKPKAAEKAHERRKREINALSAISHPHLPEILDYHVDDGWFVTRYYKNGPLSEHMTKYKGDAAGALKAVRGIVDALAGMFALEEPLVHRDVKPDNIFVADDDRLVLGDLGLVFSLGAEVRLSSTGESAGTSGWMAPWAEGKRQEETTFALDVYGIAKVLYCLIAGESKLFREDCWEENSLEKLFSGRPGMAEVNRLLRRCLVDKEVKCRYEDYPSLLRDIDSIIDDIARQRPEMLDRMGWHCRVCKRGVYQVKDFDTRVRATEHETMKKFGLEPAGMARQFKLGICSQCGHVELFTWRGKTPPAAWLEEPTT